LFYSNVNSVDINDSNVQICAKDIILNPFELSLDHLDDHNTHANAGERSEE
jgi:hypothetical protein